MSRRGVTIATAILLTIAGPPRASNATAAEEPAARDEQAVAIERLNDALRSERSRSRRTAVGLGIASIGIGVATILAAEEASPESDDRKREAIRGVCGAVSIVVGFMVFLGGVRGGPPLPADASEDTNDDD